MNLRQLEIFRAVMQTGSTRAAAEALRISQPAVSNIVRQFESQLGFSLFHRVGGRLRPTREAHSLFEGSENVFSSFDSVQTLAEDLRRGWAGTLKLAVSPSLGHTLLPRVIAEMLVERPKVRIKMDTPSNERIVEMLAGGQADMALTITPIDHPAVRLSILREGRIFCALPLGHPLTSHKTIHVADLAGSRMISFQRDQGIGILINNVFRDAGLMLEPTVEVRFALTALSLVKAGVGVALIDDFTLAYLERPDHLTLRPVETDRTVPLVLACQKSEPLSVLASAFVEICMRRI